MRTQLPPGSSAPQAPTDVTLVGDLLTAPFPAAGTQRKTRSIWLKLPIDAPRVTTTSTAYYHDAADGQMKPVGDPASATLTIDENMQSAAQSATAVLDAITGAHLFDVLLLQKIKNDAAAPISSATMVGVGKQSKSPEKASTRAREAYFLAFAERVRDEVKLPLMITGGLRSATAMSEALAAGMDVIGIARGLDPDPQIEGKLGLLRIFLRGRVLPRRRRGG